MLGEPLDTRCLTPLWRAGVLPPNVLLKFNSEVSSRVLPEMALCYIQLGKWNGKKHSSVFHYGFVFSSPPHCYFGVVHVPEVTKCFLRSCGLIPGSTAPLIVPAWQCCVWELASSLWRQHCKDKHFPLPITSSSLQLGNLFIAQLSIFSQATFRITPCCPFLNIKSLLL